MYKKLVDLRGQLQADKKRLETEVIGLQALADRPEPKPFDEHLAASRITAAKTKDHMEVTKTTEAVIKAVDKEREESVKNLEEIAATKAEAQQPLKQKAAALHSVDSEISALKWKIKAIIDAEAKERIKSKLEEYRHAAVSLLNALIEIDALNVVISDDPHGKLPNFVLMVESLPTVGIDSAEPWDVNAGGNKLIFPHEKKFQAVQDKYLEIIKEIKEELYGN